MKGALFMCLHATSRLSAPFAVSLQQGWTADNTASVINSFPVLSGPATDFFCSNIIVVEMKKGAGTRTLVRVWPPDKVCTSSL